MRAATAMRLALARSLSQCFRQLPGNLPLQLSANAFSSGFSGLDEAQPGSGPLSGGGYHLAGRLGPAVARYGLRALPLTFPP